jgi:spore coat protein A
MAFRVSADPVDDPSVIPATLRPAPLVPPGPAIRTRQLLLFEGVDEYGRLRPQLGTVEDGALLWSDPITENPMLDDVEVWEVFNATVDAHPIHLHLVSFQILDRQRFKAKVEEDGRLTRLRVIGKPRKPADNEAGWKDTAQMFPGEVTRVIAKFDREGLYVWHCHILSHEDHAMMRPFRVHPPAPPPGGAPAAASSSLDANGAIPLPLSLLQPEHELMLQTPAAGGGTLPEAITVPAAVLDRSSRHGTHALRDEDFTGLLRDAKTTYLTRDLFFAEFEQWPLGAPLLGGSAGL